MIKIYNSDVDVSDGEVGSLWKNNKLYNWDHEHHPKKGFISEYLSVFFLKEEFQGSHYSNLVLKLRRLRIKKKMVIPERMRTSFQMKRMLSPFSITAFTMI